MDAQKPKFIFKSRTILVNLIIAIVTASAYLGGGEDWIKEHGALCILLINAANVLLRLVTKKAVALFPDDDDSGAGLFGLLIGMALCFWVCFGLAACQTQRHAAAFRDMRPIPVGKRIVPASDIRGFVIPLEGQCFAHVPRAAESDLVRALEQMEPIR